MEHPKDIGDRATLAVMLALCRAGYALLLPFGKNTRYDLVIDDGARLVRVQCKSGRLRSGAVRFKTSSSYAHHARPPVRSRHYEGQVDYFAVFCAETQGVYLIPMEDVKTRWECALRVEPPRNSQRRRIRRASDFLVRPLADESARPKQLALAT